MLACLAPSGSGSGTPEACRPRQPQPSTPAPHGRSLRAPPTLLRPRGRAGARARTAAHSAVAHSAGAPSPPPLAQLSFGSARTTAQHSFGSPRSAAKHSFGLPRSGDQPSHGSSRPNAASAGAADLADASPPPLAAAEAPSEEGAEENQIRLPRYIWRSFAALVLGGQVMVRVMTGRIHWRNTFQQLGIVGPGSLGVSLLTACFVGMAFTIQFVKEFTRLGLTRSVGGVLSLALARELSPVVTAIIMAGRVGSSFAAELGTMQVSEQTDTLRVLKTDPVDYLITPRVLACSLALPVLTLICFSVGLAASIFLAEAVFNVSANVILDSAARALQVRDLASMMVKSVVFGGIIADVSCAWGMTTLGGAKGVGESTTSAVVISLVCVFIADFALSWIFFQGAGGDSLKAAMG